MVGELGAATALTPELSEGPGDKMVNTLGGKIEEAMPRKVFQKKFEARHSRGLDIKIKDDLRRTAEWRVV